MIPRRHQTELARIADRIAQGDRIDRILVSVTPGGGKSALPGILAGHFARFGDWRLALSAYNKGADRVLQTGLAVRYLKLIDEAMDEISKRL